MVRNDVAKFTPALITWAINRSNLSREELVKKLNIQAAVLETWEMGTAHPPAAMASRLAAVLNTPFGYFYHTTPPKEDLPIPDRRTLDDGQPRSLSPEFRDALYLAMSQYEWYRDYASEEGAQPLPFVGSFTINNDVKSVAAGIRKTLGINPQLRYGLTRWSDYLTSLVHQAEGVGIIVMRRGIVKGNTKRSLKTQEFQGFAISDNLTPIVFINSNDFEAAKIFTLIHEIAHIWVGKSGISTVEEIPQKTPEGLETFCNSVAAEVLVPEAEFVTMWQDTGQIEEIDALARQFFVSTLVILRRARELALISFPIFSRLRGEAIDQMKAFPTKKGGPGVRRSLDTRNSHIIMDAVIRDVKQGGTTYRDGAQLLGTRLPTFVNVMEGKYKA